MKCHSTGTAMAHTQAAGPYAKLVRDGAFGAAGALREHDAALWLAPQQAQGKWPRCFGWARGAEAAKEGPEHRAILSQPPGAEDETAWMIDYQPRRWPRVTAARKETRYAAHGGNFEAQEPLHRQSRSPAAAARKSRIFEAGGICARALAITSSDFTPGNA